MTGTARAETRVHERVEDERLTDETSRKYVAKTLARRAAWLQQLGSS